MNEDYVDFETAKMLLELKYLWNSFKPIYDKGKLIKSGRSFSNGHPSDFNNQYYPAPTLYQAQKFLREKYNCDVIVNIDGSFSMPYQFRVYTKADVIVSKNYETYEHALSEGIKETCKYLLNILENNEVKN